MCVVLGMAQNIESALAEMNEQTKIIPGHGPLANKADLASYLEMLNATTKEVLAMKKRGQSLQDMQQQGLSKQWQSWAQGFISEKMWIAIIYSSI